jgi:hypothetical protein
LSVVPPSIVPSSAAAAGSLSANGDDGDVRQTPTARAADDHRAADDDPYAARW